MRYRTDGASILAPGGSTFIPKGLNLGTFLADGGLYPNNTATEASADLARSLGINTVRAVLYVTTRYGYSLRNSAYGYKGAKGLDALVKVVAEVVSLYRSRGIVVILEAHDFTTTGATEQHYAEAADFWALMAQTYWRDSGVWFNLMNEPPIMDAEWHDRHSVMLSRVRAVAQNIIVVDAPKWGQDIAPSYGGTLYAYQPSMAPALADQFGNLVLSVHNYGAASSNRSASGFGSYIDKVQASGVPLLVGEIGFTNDGSGSSYAYNRAGALAAIEACPSRGVGVLWWASAFNDKFSLYAPRTDGGKAWQFWDYANAPLSDGGQLMTGYWSS